MSQNHRASLVIQHEVLGEKNTGRVDSRDSPSSSEVALNPVSDLVGSGAREPPLPLPSAPLAFVLCCLIPLLSPCAESTLYSGGIVESFYSKAMVGGREEGKEY